MAMIFVVPVLMVLMGVTGNAGNHLLDYASTNVYWKTKGVNVSVETMLREVPAAKAEDVSDLIKELGADDPQTREQGARKLLLKGESALPALREASKSPYPEVAATAKSLVERISLTAKAAAVRRLMAIRTLGELKKPEALPTLRSLLESKDMFVAEYARRAIASIEGKPFSFNPVTSEQRKSDLWLLPAEVSAVGQHAGLGREMITIDQIVAMVPRDVGGDFFKPDEMLKEVTRNVIEIAEQVGDIRLDLATAGLSGEVSPDAGFGVVVFRGEYDSAAARAALRKVQVESKRVGDFEVFKPEDEAALICPSDNTVVLMYGAGAQHLPVDAMTKAVAAGKGTLDTNKELAGLIGSIDTSNPVWAAVKVTRSYREAPVIRAFDTITVVARYSGKTANVEINGKGSNEQDVKDAVALVNTTIQQGINQIKPMVEKMPSLKPVLDAMQSIKCTADGKAAKLTGSMTTDIGSLIGGVMGAIGGQADMEERPAERPAVTRPVVAPEK